MDIEQQKQDILVKALVNIPFEGWSLDTFRAAAIECGHDPLVVDALFPQGLHDTLKTFSLWADTQTLKVLKMIDTADMRIRDRVMMGVQKRIDILTPHKEAVRESAKILSRPQYLRLGTQITWDCADMIWTWAGDTATDYNRHTKRGLLSGVIGATMLYWLQDDSDNSEKTSLFLERRIENVLFIGKNASRIIKPVASLFERFIVPQKAGENYER